MPPEANIPAIAKAAWQPKIFAVHPRRSELLALKPDWPCRPVRLRVHRNMPFEFVASALPAFLAYADLKADIIIGDYDDSLHFQAREPADCELIWLDFTRYAGRLESGGLAVWLKERMQALRALTKAPILVADDGRLDEKATALLAAIPGCRIFPRQKLQEQLGTRWLDERVQKISASNMSDAASLACAQLLGLVWLPAALGPALKAIVLDLDNTLYAGVLGEDGVSGVRLTPAHRALQEKIKQLKQQGLFLALLSRNEEADVEELFAKREDFPIKWQDFSATAVSWRDKSEELRAIAARLRIDPAAMLVLDDNTGEIANLARHFPATPLLHAADPELTARALDLFPCLMRWHRDETDALRADDLKAAEARAAELASAPDAAEYMRSLEIKLQFWLDPKHLLGRLADLAGKTNQFALALARFNEAEVARRLGDPRCATIAVALSDKLSDSGVIAAIFCRAAERGLIVDDICISCRALGRGMENALILAALERARKKLGGDKIAFAYHRGPRNDPARMWLGQFTGAALVSEKGTRTATWTDLQGKRPDLPVTIVWEKTERAA